MSEVRLSAGWSAHQLTEFLHAISTCTSVAAVHAMAAERVAEAFEADVVAILDDQALRASVGLAHSAQNAEQLIAVAKGDLQALEVPGLGSCIATSAGVAGSPVRIVVAQQGDLPFMAEERGLLRSMVRVMLLAVQKLELVTSLRERQELLSRLATIQRSISHRAELTDVLDAITRGLSELFDDEVALIRLLDVARPDTHLLISYHGIGPRVAAQMSRMRLGTGPMGRAMRDSTLVVSGATERDALPTALVADGVYAVMAAPVHEGGRTVGALLVGSRDPSREYSAHEQEALMAFAEHTSLALTDAEALAGMKRVNLDPLTRLPNRTLFAQRLKTVQATLADGGRLAVVFIDIDRFKAINDSLGHAAGDRVLITIAERIAASVREGDVVARLGGDEFTVLLENTHSREEVERVVDRITTALSAPVVVDGSTVVVTASIGIAYHEPPGEPASDLVADADVAMYQAKARGSGYAETFTAEMGERARRRFRLETCLRSAIARDALILAYQPLVEVRHGVRVTSAEALLRWPPGEESFGVAETIAVAEETGLINDLGAWAIHRVCRQLRQWRDEGIDRNRLPHLHVNVSGHQLRDRLLVETVTRATAANGLDPDELTLEITESVLIGNDAPSRDALAQLRDIGVRLALDDFGQGYSSLAYLDELDLQTLKIDGRFTARLGDPRVDVLVRHVVALAQELGMTVVAEGVETSIQLARLRAMGCDVAQGFLFSAAVAPEAIPPLVVGKAAPTTADHHTPRVTASRA